MDEHAALSPHTDDDEAGPWGLLMLLGAAVIGGAVAYLIVRARNERRDPQQEANRIVTRAQEKVSELERRVGDLRSAWEALE